MTSFKQVSQNVSLRHRSPCIECRLAHCQVTCLAHCVELSKLNKEGIVTKHIDASTSKKDRKIIFQELESGAINIVLNVGVLIEGFDLPSATGLLLFHTVSLAQYIQMIGRVKRSFSRKEYCIVLDFSYNYYTHGNPDVSQIDWEEKFWESQKPKKESM